MTTYAHEQGHLLENIMCHLNGQRIARYNYIHVNFDTNKAVMPIKICTHAIILRRYSEIIYVQV